MMTIAAFVTGPALHDAVLERHPYRSCCSLPPVLQYVALYRQFLERKHLEGASATARAAAVRPAASQGRAVQLMAGRNAVDWGSFCPNLPTLLLPSTQPMEWHGMAWNAAAELTRCPSPPAAPGRLRRQMSSWCLWSGG